jgi:hypothetical protein
MQVPSAARNGALVARDVAYRLRMHLWRIRRSHGYSSSLPSEFKPILDDLLSNGMAKCEAFASAELIASVRNDLCRELASGQHLVPVSNDAVRDQGSLASPKSFLTADVLCQGPSAYRELTNYVALEQPFLRSDGALRLALDERLLSIASAYLGGPAAIGGSNLRRSFRNSLTEFDTLWFHSDPNSPRILKVFFYLTEVDENSGPFCHVRGSHKKKFKNWRVSYRLTDNDIHRHYSDTDIRLALGSPGSVVLADTTGFHRGTKCKSHDRDMLTINYVLEPEFGGKAEVPLVPSDFKMDDLSDAQRRALDFTARPTSPDHDV